MAQPRIGRPDRLAALGGPIGPLAGPGPIARFLRDSQRAPASPRAIRDRAADLADLLAPLPGALGEIGTRINRHCAVTARDTARDAELAQMVENLRARTFDLWLAVGRLRAVANGKGDA